MFTLQLYRTTITNQMTVMEHSTGTNIDSNSTGMQHTKLYRAILYCEDGPLSTTGTIVQLYATIPQVQLDTRTLLPDENSNRRLLRI